MGKDRADKSGRRSTSWMRDLSLKHKLVAIIMLTSVVALSLAGAVFMVWEWTNLRHTMVLDMSSHADILADNCKAAIAFEDPTDAAHVLEGVETVPSILMACVYTEDGRLFAAHVHQGVTATVPKIDELPQYHVFGEDILTLTRPILLEQERIGRICVKADLGPMQMRLKYAAAMIFGICLISSVAAYFASSRLQRVISSPILYLAGVARFVSEKKLYGVRAEKHSSDEVGMLIQAFNDMLGQIQQRDSALVQANEQLETRVQERTSELTSANKQLTQEIAFRKKAEHTLTERTERILHHQKTLIRLNRQVNKNLPSMIRKTTQEAAKTLRVERVSVWLLNESSGELICEDLYELSGDTHDSGLRFRPGDYPSYRKALEGSRIVAASCAREDPRTAELNKDMLEPFGTVSMMDVPIRLHGRILGVICHEHTGEQREWSLEEQDFAGSIADMIALQIEANERRKAERALAKANEELAETVGELRRSNKELQDFAYVTAHDLKAPLRGIGTLADWIMADYSEKLDDAGRAQLQLLKGRVSRMSELIDSILHYSEIGRTSKRIEPVDLSILVPEVVAQITPPENIEIVIESQLPVIVTEKVRMIQVFQNLIGNAIKYMDKARGCIRISCACDEESWTFSITDNGPGIEQKYFGKIFQMFQTLTRRDEMESTGIGLAVVKKIVDLYGGRVWVESQLGEGTTFSFTLPKRTTLPAEMLAISQTTDPSVYEPSERAEDC